MGSIAENEEESCVLCGNSTEDTIGVCWTCRDRGPRLENPEIYRIRLRLGAYYHVLNEDMAFQAELQRLDTDLGARLRDLQMYSYRIDAYLGDWPLMLIDNYEIRAIVHRLRRFAGEWRLPVDRGAQDLYDSLLLGNAPLALQPGSFSMAGGLAKGTITPFCPPSFEYDPTAAGWQWVRDYAEKMAEKVRKSILDQAQELERQAKQAGYEPLSPKHHDAETVLTMARRLYRHVIKGRSYKDIAREDCVTLRAAEKGIVSWARELNIPLP